MKLSPRSFAVGALVALLALTVQIHTSEAGAGVFRGLRSVVNDFVGQVNVIRMLAMSAELKAKFPYLQDGDEPSTDQQKYIDAQGRVCTGSVDINGDVTPSDKNQALLKSVSDLTYTQFTKFIKTKADSSAAMEYVSAMAPMFVIIAFGLLVWAFLTLPFWACCCCNCCRRGCSCCCCRRPTQQYKVSVCCKWTLVGGYSSWAVVFFIFAFLGVSYSAQISTGIKDVQCSIFKFSESVLFGDKAATDGRAFPGTAGVINFMRQLENNFDPASQTIADIKKNIDDNLNFDTTINDFNHKLTFASASTNAVGGSLKPRFGDYMHSYYYANGIPGDDTFKGAPMIFDALRDQLGTGLVKALNDVRTQVKGIFDDVSDTSTLGTARIALRNGVGPMKEMQNVVDDNLSKIGFNAEDQVKAGDSARNAAMIAIEVFAAVIFGLGVLEVLRVFFCSKQDYPNPLGSCCGYCCYLPCAGFFLVVGGLVLAVSAVMGNACVFIREDLITENQWAEYAKTFSFNDQQTIDLATQCLSVKGQGDILTALNLSDKFDFKKTLDDVFAGLRDNTDSPALTQEQLDDLARSTQFANDIGWWFAANIDQAPNNVPEYDYRAPFDEVLVSGIQKEDRTTGLPAPLDKVYGLQSIEAKIAPFFFGLETDMHTTAEITALTAACPLVVKTKCLIRGDVDSWFDDNLQEINSQAPGADDAEKNRYVASVFWAHQKARFHAGGFETVAFKEDAEANNYMDTPQTATYDEFTQNVLTTANLVDAASQQLVTEITGDLATKVIDSVQYSIQVAILDVVDAFLKSINCTFMLRGINGVLDGLCTGVVPGMANSAASWVVMGVFGFLCFCWMFHIWKYLKDNIEIGQEISSASGAAAYANQVQPNAYGQPVGMS